MTLASTAARADYTGSGSAGPFSYPFKIFAATDLVVTKRSTTGAESTLSYPTDYTVSDVGETAGGSVTLSVALATGEALTIQRVVPLTQPTDFRNQGRFLPSTEEDALDRMVMQGQGTKDAVDRSFKLGPTYDPTDYTVAIGPATEDGQVLGWSDDGLAWRTVSDEAVVLPGDGRTMTSLSAYLEHNALFNVRDFGAVGNGTTDDTAAIAACAAAAGIGGHLYFPPGRYVCAGDTLTGFPIQQTWEGAGFQLGVGGTTSVTELRFTGLSGTQVGLVASTNQVFKRLLFRGPGGSGNTCVGLRSTSGSPRFYECQFYSWYLANDIQNAYYTIYGSGCEFVYNATAIKTIGCYNMHHFGTRFGGAFATVGYFSNCIQVVDAIKHLVMHGGSAEGYDSGGGFQIPGDSLADFFGMYFESSEATSASFGIQVSGTGTTINLFGNQVYLTNANRWFNASGLNGITVNGKGNKFVCSAGSVTTPTAYILPTNGTLGTVDLSGDDWSDVALAGATYVGGTLNAGAVRNKRVVPPTGLTAFLAEHTFLDRPTLSPKLTTAPTTPIVGGLYLADNSGWDPLARTGTDPYFVAYDGSRYLPVGHITFKNTATWDPASLAAGAQTTTTVTVTGAALGDPVQVTFSLDLQGLTLTGYVSAANTVTAVLRNGTAGTIDLASGTLLAIATRH